MITPHPSACLILLRHGRPAANFPLEGDKATLGRDKTNSIVLTDPSVSRNHAEILLTDDGASLRDLGSRNGVRVNGVPRKQATLQSGDKVVIGSVEMLFTCGAMNAPAPRVEAALQLAQEVKLTETKRQSLRLPDAKPERHLAAFYHLCSWITEGVDETNGLATWLDLLIESLRAHTVHYYDAGHMLAHVGTRESIKPKVKFAPYLLERFQKLGEATAYAPKELDRYQERLGKYHYLVSPLRASGTKSGPCPVVVMLRPAEWEPFSVEDRVLFQSACQLWLRSGSRAAEVRELKQENTQLRQQVTSGSRGSLLGESEAMAKLRAKITRIAATKATVLITGETGSGKEVVAHCLHQESPRAKKPFIKLNCASIPASLMESELFGHVRGAFTDAQADHKGRFLLAHGGTLFLDEIGELPLNVQAKLLRVLETGEVERLGSEKTDKVDVRILAATNRDLRTQVRAGAFREDLLYRLEVARLEVLPLREHPEDIKELAPHFLRQFCAENGLADLDFAPDAVAVLQKHAWSGNVRELRNVIQRLAMDACDATITVHEIRTALK